MVAVNGVNSNNRRRPESYGFTKFKIPGRTTEMDYAKESLRLHGEWKGKIEVVTRVPVENKDDLSLA